MDIEKAIDCLKADKEYLVDMKICDGEEMDIAIKALEEIQQYREIGTVEECRMAVEKQKEERPIAVLGTFGGEEHECRECGNTVEYMDEYCKWCGKKLDWSEEDEQQKIKILPRPYAGSMGKSNDGREWRLSENSIK